MKKNRETLFTFLPNSTKLPSICRIFSQLQKLNFGNFGNFRTIEIFFKVYEILFDIFESNEISQDMCEASVATLMRSRIGVIDEINGDPSSCLAKGDPSSERYVP